MRISIVIAGKIRERYLRAGAAEYLKRLRRYARVELNEIQDEPVPDASSERRVSEARRVEGNRILKAVHDRDCVVALDVQGTQMSSQELSRWIQERGLAGESSLVFVIGGTTGLAPEILSRARLRLSMGAITFPHQFMPLLILEQLYRAFRIAEGEPYHR